MIYLDNSATTKICPEALERYIEVSNDCFGNPSSLHSAGYLAEKTVSEARRTILSALGAKGAELIFTASGSEANNLAIFGRAYAKERYRRGAKIITSEGEHASVSAPLSELERQGYKVVRIPTKCGKLDTGALEREMTADVILVTVMMVNNETGALYDIENLSRLMREHSREAVLHIDATQSFMKCPFSMQRLGADMITVSSHKIEGPKGVGALAVSDAIMKSRGLAPMILGGGQELGLRSGTENVPAIAAFGVATDIAKKSLGERYAKIEGLRQKLIENLTRSPALQAISITNPEHHAPHILNLTLPNVKSETMLHYLSSLGILVSSGSACSSNSAHISSALLAYGRTEREADCSIRISFSHRNTEDDLDELTRALESGLSKLARIR
ncbi:MAG: cysteine desulfurase [Clostridia bacterium]|nr:cysteine desulfurase [Clostridia bacterium]MBQ8720284.1 cysteine desulfurase [Clostridia bacterium]